MPDTDSGTRPQTSSNFVPEESDMFYQILRLAFVAAFVALPYFNPAGYDTSIPMRIMLITTGASVLVICLAWGRSVSLPGHRTVVIANDLCLVTATITNWGQIANPLYEVYGLIIVVAAMWFKIPGAFITAVFAIVLNGIAQQVNAGGDWVPTINGTITWNQGAPFLLILAFVSGYLVHLRDREHTSVIQIQEELHLARTLQDAMLPASLPHLPGYELAVVFQPAREVGGDIYDVRRLDPDRVILWIADLAGHSVYGFVHLSLVHSHLRAASREGPSPAEIAQAVNHRVYEELQPDSYAAVFLGVLDHTNHTLTFANCGHLPPLLLRRGATDTVEELSTGGIVIGGKREASYSEQRVALSPGDVVICYTDGIAEARNRQGEFFGTEGVVRVAQRNAAAPATVVAETILSEAARFAADVRADDVTLIVLRRTH